MTTLKIEIEEGRDISSLKQILVELGFKFSLENKDYEFENLSQFAVLSIESGLRDLEEGNVYTEEEAKSRIDSKISALRLKYAGR